MPNSDDPLSELAEAMPKDRASPRVRFFLIAACAFTAAVSVMLAVSFL